MPPTSAPFAVVCEGPPAGPGGGGKICSGAWKRGPRRVISLCNEFPGLNDPESLNAPKKPKITLVFAVKQAVNEKSEEDLRRQSRLTNVILYRIPEWNEATAEERKQNDRDTVD